MMVTELKEMIELLKGLNTEEKQLAKGVIIGLQLSKRDKAS